MLIGHQKQWTFLKKSTEKNRLAHAYLFYGPSKIGKRRIAIEFAKFLLCSQKEKPCNNCPDCYQVETFIHPDFVLIEPPEDRKHTIPIEAIRKLKSKISRSAGNSGYKIAIIDDAHWLTHDAQSALLKLLEEPSGNCVIILISEYPEMILETITSRCQPIRFHFVEKKELTGFLKERNVSKENMEFLLWLADGRPGLLYKYIESQELLEQDKQLIQDILTLKHRPLFARFNYVKKLKDKDLIDDALYVWLNYFRYLLLSEVHTRQTYQFFANKTLWSKKELIKIINLLQNIKKLLSTTNINQRLALEILLMEI